MYENVSYCGAGKFVSHGEWIHPDRVINSYELIFVINGTVYINENHNQYKLEKNDLFLLEPGVRHFGYKKSSSTSFFWVHFNNVENLNLNPISLGAVGESLPLFCILPKMRKCAILTIT
jgi:hypothetical protein